jgi:hypothetical protein
MNSGQLARWITGSALLILSLCAIVLSLGAPGLGWALSNATLLGACVVSNLIGRKWLLACLILTCLLLVTFGPLGIYESSRFDPDWPMSAFTFGPVMISLLTLLMPIWRQGRQINAAPEDQKDSST